ncbi:MAG: hypothetical protein V3U54_07935 [Thermodesulfobacteriota bacterium]
MNRFEKVRDLVKDIAARKCNKIDEYNNFVTTFPTIISIYVEHMKFCKEKESPIFTHHTARISTKQANELREEWRDEFIKTCKYPHYNLNNLEIIELHDLLVKLKFLESTNLGL